jgi:hypothetical protein
MRNTYSLKNLDVWAELNGKNFAELEKEKLDRLFTRRFIPAVIVLKESSPQVKYDVFDRLNTGGVVATPMEIRNAVFPGRFNHLLHELSETRDFRLLWSIPENETQREENYLYQTMQDLELILRFFAVPKFEGKMMLKDWLPLWFILLFIRNNALRAFRPTLGNSAVEGHRSGHFGINPPGTERSGSTSTSRDHPMCMSGFTQRILRGLPKGCGASFHR